MRLSVISPTFNNPNYLAGMVNSMNLNGFFLNPEYELIVVNNGKQPIEKDFSKIIAGRGMKVVNCVDNRGWEGGLIEGLKMSSAEYVCFQNDDVHIPQANPDFYENLIGVLSDEIGISGPITTTAAGVQSIFNPNTPVKKVKVKWLIFFCAMIRRDVLEEAGGIDEMLPGGDDFDLSIRIGKLGKSAMVVPESFIIHHGFKTGERVNGSPDKEGGWNSQLMMDRTNKALIQKHGFRTWITTLRNQSC